MPSPVKIKPGDRFGQLVVVSRVPAEEGMTKKSSWWLLDCDCGEPHVANADNLKRGKVRSCGCLRRAMARESMLMLRRHRVG